MIANMPDRGTKVPLYRSEQRYKFIMHYAQRAQAIPKAKQESNTNEIMSSLGVLLYMKKKKKRGCDRAHDRHVNGAD